MSKINDLRLKIDQIDKNILDQITARLEIVKQIGEVKKENGSEVIDMDREQQVLKRLITRAEQKGVSPEIVKKIWKILMEVSYEIEGGK